MPFSRESLQLASLRLLCRDTAALASAEAAAKYGLQVLQRGVCESKPNTTRFIVLSRSACLLIAQPAPQACCEAAPDLAADLHTIASFKAANAIGPDSLHMHAQPEEDVCRDALTPALSDTRPHKTSIVFSLPDDGASGQLFKALSVFALRDIDLSKIESRPLRTEPLTMRLKMGARGFRCAVSAQADRRSA